MREGTTGAPTIDEQLHALGMTNGDTYERKLSALREQTVPVLADAIEAAVTIGRALEFWDQLDASQEDIDDGRDPLTLTGESALYGVLKLLTKLLGDHHEDAEEVVSWSDGNEFRALLRARLRPGQPEEIAALLAG